MFRVIFTKAAQNFKFPMHTTPSQCPIFRTSPSPFYTPKPEPGFQLCSAHGLGGSCIANEEKCSSEVAFLLLLLLCTVLIGATDLLFTIFPVCKSTLDSQKFFCWPSGSHFLKEFSIQMTPSFPEKKKISIYFDVLRSPNSWKCVLTFLSAYVCSTIFHKEQGWNTRSSVRMICETIYFSNWTLSRKRFYLFPNSVMTT